MQNKISGNSVAKEDLKIIGKSIGKRIITLRKLKKITQKELSKKTKISLLAMSKIENGKKMISIEEAKTIAKILNSNPKFIIGGE